MTTIALGDRHTRDCAWHRLFREIADQSQSFITRFTSRKQPPHLLLFDEISVRRAKDRSLCPISKEVAFHARSAPCWLGSTRLHRLRRTRQCWSMIKETGD